MTSEGTQCRAGVRRRQSDETGQQMSAFKSSPVGLERRSERQVQKTQVCAMLRRKLEVMERCPHKVIALMGWVCQVDSLKQIQLLAAVLVAAARAKADRNVSRDRGSEQLLSEPDGRITAPAKLRDDGVSAIIYYVSRTDVAESLWLVYRMVLPSNGSLEGGCWVRVGLWVAPCWQCSDGDTVESVFVHDSRRRH